VSPGSETRARDIALVDGSAGARAPNPDLAKLISHKYSAEPPQKFCLVLRRCICYPRHLE